MDKASQFAVAAAYQALTDAGLQTNPIDNKGLGQRGGIVIGTGLAGIETLEQGVVRYYNNGRVLPTAVPMLMPNAPPANVSMQFGLTGPSTSVATACAAGSAAIATAYNLLKAGAYDFIVTGGTEATMTPFTYEAFANMGALCVDSNDKPEKGSRPFSKDRAGFVMAEGAGMLILETEAHANARGARIYAELLSYGWNTDAFHLTEPDEDRIRQCIQECVSKALPRNAVRLVDYINAHGTSTPYNDLYESRAIANVFGEHAKDLLVSSTKSATGHMIGAAGGIEALVCCKAIETGMVPPTINLDNPDPELVKLGLNYVPHHAVKRQINHALSNSFGFGGHNVVLWFARYNEPKDQRRNDEYADFTSC